MLVPNVPEPGGTRQRPRYSEVLSGVVLGLSWVS